MTKLEECARAIAAEDHASVGDYTRMARAALLALREPDAAMQKAGDDKGGLAGEWSYDGKVHHARYSFPAMIDAVLDNKD